MQALLITAAMVLTGPPMPAHKLFVASHSGTKEAARVKAELATDPWINCRFEVQFIERDYLQPRWSTSLRGEYVEFPHPDDAPSGAWCTPGMASVWIRPALLQHMKEMDEHCRAYVFEPDWCPLNSTWRLQTFYGMNQEQSEATPVWPRFFRHQPPSPVAPAPAPPEE